MINWVSWSIFGIKDIIDILVVAVMVYYLVKLIHDTRAELLLKGMIIVIIVQQVSQFLRLHTINYILQGVLQMGIIAVIILFQPEIRRVLETTGNSAIGRFFRLENPFGGEDTKETISGICEAAGYFSKYKIGSLIVLERHTKIGDIIRTGVMMNSLVSSELLVNIFSHNTPLHDGAVVIRDNRIMAAACLLPLTPNQNLGTELGTRHRAAIGITETSDVAVVVTSEETGKISLAKGGALTRNLTVSSLESALSSILDVAPKADDEPKKRSRFLKEDSR